MFIFKRSSSCADLNWKSLPSLHDYWGKYHALITSVDKPSRVRSGTTRTLPYPTLHCPALPYPTLPLPLHHPYPSPTIPYPALPYPPYPYPTPTIPYDINMASLPFKMTFILYGFVQFEQWVVFGYFYL